MAKTTLMQLWESRLGQSMQEILRDRFEQYGTYAQVAESLDISLVTLYDWMDRMGGVVVRRNTVRFPSEEKAATP